MCCFFAERAALGSKIKDCLACYQDNLPKWSNMSTRGHLKACWSHPKRTSRSSHRNATCSWHYVDVNARIWRSVEIIDHSLMVQLMHFFHIVEWANCVIKTSICLLHVNLQFIFIIPCTCMHSVLIYKLVCGKITNCNHRDCTDNNNNLVCSWCDGEVAERQYWRAYTGHLDSRKSCQSKSH